MSALQNYNYMTITFTMSVKNKIILAYSLQSAAH